MMFSVAHRHLYINKEDGSVREIYTRTFVTRGGPAARTRPTDQPAYYAPANDFGTYSGTTVAYDRTDVATAIGARNRHIHRLLGAEYGGGTGRRRDDRHDRG